MLILSRYILKTVVLTTLMISVILTLIIWLTQSLRLLDFIINGGAPLSLFGGMLIMTMPRFLEIILPISLALGIVYSLNKFSNDSELVVMQNIGASPAKLGKGIFFFSVFVALLVLLTAGWATPLANRELDHMRDVVKSDYSFGLLRPGVFNVINDNTTIYISNRSDLQDLRGVFIYLNDDPGKAATTITAAHGGLVIQDKKPFVIVFDGMRQQFNAKTGNVDTLKFERYSLNLSALTNNDGGLDQNDPGEKTLDQLFQPNIQVNPLEGKYAAAAELHNRISKFFLTIAFALLATIPFLVSHYNRRGQSIRVTFIIIGVLLLQIAYMGASYFARKSLIGLTGIYIIPGITIIALLIQLTGDENRQRILAPIHWLIGGRERLI
jgi:lipopolysaccharide export system permease protein